MILLFNCAYIENHAKIHCMKNIRFKRIENARNTFYTKWDINGHDGNKRHKCAIRVCKHFCDM